MIRRLLLPTIAVGLLAATACTDNAPAPAPGDTEANARVLTVAASDTECKVSAAEAPSGTITFKVTNEGTKINEFYLLGEDGLRIIAEIENVGPGLTRDLVLTAPAGTYFTACNNAGK